MQFFTVLPVFKPIICLVKCSSLDHSHIVKRDINMLHAKNTS